MSARRGLLVIAGIALALLAGALVWNRGRETVTRAAASDPAANTVRATAGIAPANDVRATADRVLASLNARDGTALAALVHPDGVRISPSAYVNVATDQVLPAAEAATLWTDTRVRTWGSAEASDDPIDLTPADYAARYIVDRDYSAATVTINDDTRRGTTVDNSAEVYPDAMRVTYFVAGQDATDWSALRLILAPEGEEWRLIGIVHDAWSP